MRSNYVGRWVMQLNRIVVAGAITEGALVSIVGYAYQLVPLSSVMTTLHTLCGCYIGELCYLQYGETFNVLRAHGLLVRSAITVLQAFRTSSGSRFVIISINAPCFFSLTCSQTYIGMITILRALKAFPVLELPLFCKLTILL